MNTQPNDSYSEFLEAEIRYILNHDNEEFIRTYSHLVPAVIARSSWRVQKLSSCNFLRLYAELVDELAQSEKTVGEFRDHTIAGICISLQLQRRLNKVVTRMRDLKSNNGAQKAA